MDGGDVWSGGGGLVLDSTHSAFTGIIHRESLGSDTNGRGASQLILNRTPAISIFRYSDIPTAEIEGSVVFWPKETP